MQKWLNERETHGLEVILFPIEKNEPLITDA